MQTIMRGAEISFPMLGDVHFNPPASFTLFGRSLSWSLSSSQTFVTETDVVSGT